ncbi:MAG: class II aldolase/adducin family protein [Roseibacillus sp.]|nr:class II aldolase/adducin family protein [Roseibacillus sp.]
MRTSIVWTGKPPLVQKSAWEIPRRLQEDLWLGSSLTGPSSVREIMNNMPLEELLRLSHEIGREDRRLAILGEGNTSARISEDEFLVKASGSCLENLRSDQVTRCLSSKVLTLMEDSERLFSNEEVDEILQASRCDPGAKKPSIETMFHAWLLSLDGVDFVGHCHSEAANKILCSKRARDFAENRMFPDEIVCCGRASVFVENCDPGLPLARGIQRETREYIQEHGEAPRLILLENHGIIGLGKTADAVLACTFMADKAANIFEGAASLGGPVFLPRDQIERIAGRPDEVYRQKQLNL